MHATALLTVTVIVETVDTCPAASRATAVKVWLAFVAPVVFQLTLYGDVVSSLPRFAPSSLNCTPTTPTLSLAVAVTETVAETVAPFVGAVRDTVGAVLSQLWVKAGWLTKVLQLLASAQVRDCVLFVQVDQEPHDQDSVHDPLAPYAPISDPPVPAPTAGDVAWRW